MLNNTFHDERLLFVQYFLLALLAPNIAALPTRLHYQLRYQHHYGYQRH